jgi:hypothetical protein
LLSKSREVLFMAFSTTQLAASSPVLERSSISWRAIFAGAFISLLAYFILMALGLAIGGATLRGVISGDSSAQGLGIGSGIWLIVTAFISLYFGSYMAGRVSGLITSRVGGVQGLVITALFFGFLFTQVGAGIGALGSGLGSIVGKVGGAAGDMAQNPQVKSVIEKSLGSLNLKSPPDQVAQGVASRLIQGRDDDAKNFLASQAGISRPDADRRIAQARTDIQSTLHDVGVTAAKITTIAGWTIFGMLLIGALAGVYGGGGGARANLKRPLSEGDLRKLDQRSRAA